MARTRKRGNKSKCRNKSKHKNKSVKRKQLKKGICGGNTPEKKENRMIYYSKRQ